MSCAAKACAEKVKKTQADMNKQTVFLMIVLVLRSVFYHYDPQRRIRAKRIRFTAGLRGENRASGCRGDSGKKRPLHERLEINTVFHTGNGDLLTGLLRGVKITILKNM